MLHQSPWAETIHRSCRNQLSIRVVSMVPFLQTPLRRIVPYLCPKSSRRSACCRLRGPCLESCTARSLSTPRRTSLVEQVERPCRSFRIRRLRYPCRQTRSSRTDCRSIHRETTTRSLAIRRALKAVENGFLNLGGGGYGKQKDCC